MKKALLPALIAAMFATSVGAAERELLFGPDDDLPKATKPAIKKEGQKAPALAPVAKKEEPKVAAPEPVVAKKEEPKATTAAPVVAVKKEEPKAAVPAPVVAKKEEPKAATAAPVVAVKKEEPKAAVPAPVVAKKEEPKVDPAAKAAIAVAPAMPALPSVASGPAKPSAPVFSSGAGDVKVIASTDPMSERARLAAALPDAMNVGFLPSTTTNADNFSFLSNYLPLANFLSEQTRVLINFVPERDAAQYRKNIIDNRYAVIFAHVGFAREAMKAGYEPLVVGEDAVAPAYVVKKDSRFKSVADIKGAKIAWARSTPASLLAMGDLAAAEKVKENTFTDVGTASKAGVLSALTAGTADVAILRSNDAEKAVAESKGELVSIGTGTTAPFFGVWVRKDFAGNPVAAKMAQALQELRVDAKGSAQVAAYGFSKGYGLKGHFVPASAAYVGDISKTVASAEKGFPDAFGPTKSSETAKTANLARPVITKHALASTGSDALTEHSNLIAKMKEGTNVGFFVPGSVGKDAYTFQNNFMPLSNYLSDQSGVLVSLVPELNAADFAKRIGNNEYAVIVVNATLAQAAASSGYTPVARSGDVVTAAFVVPIGSKITKVEDLAGKHVATYRTADAAQVGRWDLVKAGVKDVNFDFIGSSSDARKVLSESSADAALIRASDADAMVAKFKGTDGKSLYRVIPVKQEVPALSMWVRAESKASPVVKSLSEAMVGFQPEGNALRQRAFAGYSRGFGFDHAWALASVEDTKPAVEMTAALIKANQAVVGDVKGSAAVVKVNRERSVTYSLVKAETRIKATKAVKKAK